MKIRFVVGLVVIAFALALWAADTVARLNVKEGLWEMTTTRSMTGGPSIPADTLAKMPPDQRARVEAMMKENGMSSTPATTVRKECVTKEKLDQRSAFSEDRKDSHCTRTVVNSSGSRLEMKIHCGGKDTESNGSFLLEAQGSDAVKGNFQLETNAKGHAMNMSMSFTGRYLGPACGDVQ